MAWDKWLTSRVMRGSCAADAQPQTARLGVRMCLASGEAQQ